jgi:hypothetical protein
MCYARRTDRASRVHGVERAAAARTRARAVAAAGVIAAAAVGWWPRAADAYDNPELMGGVHKAAQGGEAGDAAARAARAAGNAETGGVARFALIVGANRGSDPALPLLHYADDDAARYGELFGALGVRVHLLTRPDENTLRVSADAVSNARPPVRAELARAVDELAREVAIARERGRRVVFYFVYAGHGNVKDNTAYLALEDQRLDSRDIERQIIDRVHANQTHLIIDACYSYSLAKVRGPGGSRHDVVGPFAAVVGLVRRPDVGLLLSTTSTNESHEWSNFQAGIFSHEVRSGVDGAADIDGDGQVSYDEIGAFVHRANEAVPNERYRPLVFTKAPREDNQLVDLRQASGRRLKIEAGAGGAHFFLENLFGVRLADFHSRPGQPVFLVVPIGAQPLFLRRVDDGQQLAIPADAEVVAMGALAQRGPNQGVPEASPREYAFNLIFSLPYDKEALASYSERTQDGESLVARHRACAAGHRGRGP